MCACLGISQGMMMPCQFVPAGRCDCLELMIGQAPSEMPTGGSESVEESIIGIIHLVNTEHRLEAPLVETGIMGDQRKVSNQRRYLLPDIGKNERILSIFRPQPVNSPAKPLIVIRLRMNKAVDGIDNLASAYDNHADAANAGRLLVGCLKVYGGEICHGLSKLSKIRFFSSYHKNVPYKTTW